MWGWHFPACWTARRNKNRRWRLEIQIVKRTGLGFKFDTRLLPRAVGCKRFPPQGVMNLPLKAKRKWSPVLGFRPSQGAFRRVRRTLLDWPRGRSVAKGSPPDEAPSARRPRVAPSAPDYREWGHGPASPVFRSKSGASAGRSWLHRWRRRRGDRKEPRRRSRRQIEGRVSRKRIVRGPRGSWRAKRQRYESVRTKGRGEDRHFHAAMHEEVGRGFVFVNEDNSWLEANMKQNDLSIGKSRIQRLNGNPERRRHCPLGLTSIKTRDL